MGCSFFLLANKRLFFCMDALYVLSHLIFGHKSLPASLAMKWFILFRCVLRKDMPLKAVVVCRCFGTMWTGYGFLHNFQVHCVDVFFEIIASWEKKQ